MQKQLAVIPAIGLAFGLLAAPAAAAPKPDPADEVTLDCGGGPVPVVVGSGFWAPAFGSNHSVYVPVSFGEFTGIATDAEGNEFEIFEPPIAQGQGKGNKGGSHPLVTCTYTVTGSFEGESFEGSGEVTGFIVGKR